MSFVEKLVSQNGHKIHKVKAVESSTGMAAYYFIMLNPGREDKFLSDLEDLKSIDFDNYGKVVASCYGTEPTEDLKNFMKDKYGFDEV